MDATVTIVLPMWLLWLIFAYACIMLPLEIYSLILKRRIDKLQRGDK